VPQQRQRACSSSGCTLLLLDSLQLGSAGLDHWLKHVVGLSDRVCGARECSAGNVNSADASMFYKKFHLQGACAGLHFGLYHQQRLVACMSFARQAPERKKVMAEGSYSLTRMALAGSVPGGASRLFKHATTVLQAREIVTYSDNSYSTGGVYERLGFVCESEIPPDYRVWHSKIGLRHKSYWQRRAIPARLRDCGLTTVYHPDVDARTEFDMEALAGCMHVWDCGKKRWRWHGVNAVVKL